VAGGAPVIGKWFRLSLRKGEGRVRVSAPWSVRLDGAGSEVRARKSSRDLVCSLASWSAAVFCRFGNIARAAVRS
jgi:hypothetical protein